MTTESDLTKLTNEELDMLSSNLMKATFNIDGPEYDLVDAQWRRVADEKIRRMKLVKRREEKQVARKAKRLAAGGTWFDK